MKKKTALLIVCFVLVFGAKCYAQFPYSENFDDLTVPNLPSGWTTQNVNNDEETWVVSNNNPPTGMYGSHSDPNYLSVGVGQTNTMNDWVFTAPFRFVAATPYTLTFWLEKGSIYGDYTLDVVLCSAPNSDYIMQTIHQISNVNYDYTKIEVVFTPETTGDYYLGFGATLDVYGYPLCIDDMAIDAGEPPVALTQCYPTTETADIALNTPIYAVFDHEIKASDLSLITLSEGVTGVVVSLDGRRLSIAHDALAYGTTYTVEIPDGAIANFSGTTWQFTTVGSTPVLYQTFPANNSRGIFTTAPARLRFNQEIVITNPDNISIDAGVSGISATANGKELIISHNPFDCDKTYTLHIPDGTIERFDENITLSFKTVHAGDIPDLTALYGPIESVTNVRHVSDNGRYLCGQLTGSKGFMWDILEDDYYVLSTIGGEAFQVSNMGHVAFRNYSDEGKVVPTIWFEANCSDLSEPSGGDVIVITPDATKAAGHVARETFGSIPALWTRDANNEWINEPQRWHELENAYQTSIRGLSADGSIGVGRTLISGHTGTLFEACYWPNKETMLLMNISQEKASEFTCISANGKYAGIRRAEYSPYIFDLQTQELTQLPSGDVINAITNDGLAVGISGSPQLGTVPFVYSAQLGFLTLSQFIQSAYAASRYEGIDEDIVDGISVVNRIMSVSSDGCNWALQANTDGYMLHLKRKLLAQPATMPPIGTKIYFNPLNNRVFVEGEGFNLVKIYDVFGRELTNANAQSSASFDISAFANGIYLVAVYNNGKPVDTKKIAKSNRAYSY